MNESLIREMLDLLRAQQVQNAKTIDAMLAAHTAQSHIFQSWMDMFKPTATPLLGTSPDERSTLREARELEEWDAVIPSMARAMLYGEDTSHG